MTNSTNTPIYEIHVAQVNKNPSLWAILIAANGRIIHRKNIPCSSPGQAVALAFSSLNLEGQGP